MPLFFRKPSPDAILAQLNHVDELKRLNQLQNALAAVNKVLKQAPDSALALAYRGEIQGRLGHIPEALADLEKSVRIEPTAYAYFNYSLAHYHAHNKSAALAALFRVLQLEPGDKEAQAFRVGLAQELGLAELEIAARVVEQFMYSQCGPGIGWKVELRQMYRFKPNSPHDEYNAVVLDLCHQPATLIEIEYVPPEYRVVIDIEKRFPGVSRQTMVAAVTKDIAASDAALLSVLQGFVEEGVLTLGNGSLRYNAA